MKTILIVEDEEDLRDLLATELRDSGLVVFEAANGRQAAETLRTQPVALVVTDLRMPGGDGLELLKVIRTEYKSKIRTVLMSGFADCTANHAKSLGADVLLHKPFSLTQFKDVVQELLKQPPS